MSPWQVSMRVGRSSLGAPWGHLAPPDHASSATSAHQTIRQQYGIIIHSSVTLASYFCTEYKPVSRSSCYPNYYESIIQQYGIQKVSSIAETNVHFVLSSQPSRRQTSAVKRSISFTLLRHYAKQTLTPLTCLSLMTFASASHHDFTWGECPFSILILS